MNEKWFSLSVSDIEKKLKTNAALGLTHKAARSRLSTRNGFLFEREPRGVFSLLPSVLSDFSVITVLLMSVIALCFGELATGIVCLTVSVLYLCVSLVFCYRGEKYFASAERAMSPRCRVIRQGRLYSLAPRHVVVGDIILLRQGDVVPADARLITSDSLAVRMLVEKNRYVLLDKLAEGAVASNENDPQHFVNVVHAGSIVVGGAARAVVTAVGNYTYVGAKIGCLADSRAKKDRVPRLLMSTKKLLSIVSIALLAATLPVSIFAMIFGGDSLSLFSVFMTVLSASFLCSAQFALTLYRVFYEVCARRCVMSKDVAVVRSPYSLDVLADSKYVFLLDGGAVTDGIWHLDGLCLGDGEYSDYTTSSFSAKRLAELSALYLDAKKAGLTIGNERNSRYDNAIIEFVNKAGVDEKALNIRCSTSGYIENSVGSPHDKVMFTELGEKYVLSVSYTEDIISECSCVCFENEVIEANDAFRYSATQTFRSYLEIGKRALVFSVARNEGYGVEGEKCFVGMVVFAEHTDGVAEKAKKDIETRGIRVISFKNIVADVDADMSRLPQSILGTKIADARDFVAVSKPLSDGLRDVDCYVGLTVKQIEELIEAVHEKGDRVIAVGMSDKFESIYNAADATVTVSLDKFSVDALDNVVKVKIDPNESRTAEGAQSVSRNADILVPRYTDGTGGLSSLLTAFKGSFVTANNLLWYLRYLMAVNTVRLALIILPMLLGFVTADARHLLLIGALTDILALIAFAYDSYTSLEAYKTATDMLNTPIKSNKRSVLIFGGCAVVTGILPMLFSVIPGVPAYIDRIEYSFVSLVLFHIAVFVSMRLMPKRAKGRITLITPIALLGVLGLLFVGGISNVFDIEGFSAIAYFFISLVCPVLSVFLFLFEGKKGGHGKANCK